MNFKTLLMSVMLASAGFAQESSVQQQAEPKLEEVVQKFGYVSLGVGPLPVLLPNFSVGYRTQSGHHGGDFSVQAATVIAATQVKANLLYHYYFKPSLASQFYAGGGIAPSVVFVNSRVAGTIAPELVLGKQYRNKSGDLRFFQTQIDFPTIQYGIKHTDRSTLFPIVTLSYGIGF